MYPAVPPPKKLLGRSVDVKLKPGWRYDEAKGVFVNTKGDAIAAPRLPKHARVVYKVPSLARSAPKDLSKAEKDLQRYMQVILPTSRSVTQVLKTVRSWPSIEEAHLTPDLSLPMKNAAEGLPGRKNK